MRRLAERLRQSEERLRSLRGSGGESGAQALEVVLGQRAALPGARGVRDATPTPITFTLERDVVQQVRDPSGTDGVILTGTWIIKYARLIRLEPEYERTLAAYREQAELHKQLEEALEGALAVKDKKTQILDEMVTAEKRRGDLYKTLAEIQQDSWLERIWHKIAFPAGVTIGVFAGALIANN